MRTSIVMPLLELHRRFKRQWDQLRRRKLLKDYEAVLAEPDAKSRFEGIYQHRIWARVAKNHESVSGGGSTLAATKAFRTDLEEFLIEHGGGVFFDAPCGDFNFMRHVTFPQGWRYLGGDISTSALRAARQSMPEKEFIEFDLTRDPFPGADVWLCRACLFHLSFSDIADTLANFVRSSCRIAIITSHLNVRQNDDIQTGSYRPLDLTLPPIGLPKPSRFLRDIENDLTPWIAGIWTREEVASSQIIRMT